MDLTFSIVCCVFMVILFIAVIRSRQQQDRVMKYYKDVNEDGKIVSSKSLENQARMIELLESILEKLSK